MSCLQHTPWIRSEFEGGRTYVQIGLLGLTDPCQGPSKPLLYRLLISILKRFERIQNTGGWSWFLSNRWPRKSLHVGRILPIVLFGMLYQWPFFDTTMSIPRMENSIWLYKEEICNSLSKCFTSLKYPHFRWSASVFYPKCWHHNFLSSWTYFQCQARICQANYHPVASMQLSYRPQERSSWSWTQLSLH